MSARISSRIAWLTAFLWLAFCPALRAQPVVEHAPIECVEPGRFAIVLSGIDPEQEVQTAKVYFRSSLYPDFYYVEMALEGNRFRALLPQPSPETTDIVYYIEAVDDVFNMGRSAEFYAVVKDRCRNRPAGAFFEGTPSLIVGATTAGASALPPGFSAIGIVGTITAAGVSSGIGGGIGAGVAVASAAAAAGVAGAVVVANNPAETTTAPQAAPPSSTSVATTTTAPAGGPPSSTSSTPTSIPSTTTSVPSGTTTTITGGTTTTTASISTTTSVSSSSTTTSAPISTVPSTTTIDEALNASCFTIQSLGNCAVRLDASCVNDPVERYDWELDTNDVWKKEHISHGPAVLVYSWNDCGNNPANLTFKLEVRRGSSVSVSVKTAVIAGSSLKEPPPSGTPMVRFQSHLSLPPFDGTSRGRVLLEGGLARAQDSSAPIVVQAPAASGKHRVEAIVTRAGGEPGHWRFDFGQEPRFLGGSLRAEQGMVEAIDGAVLLFRLSGTPGERLSFTFDLER